MQPPSIRCFGLTKEFGETVAVKDVNLAVDHGEKLVLLGPSGCGKTTLLRLIAGFEVPTTGTLAVGGQLVAWPRYSLPPEKRRVGMVFQDYALFPHMDVRSNVLYGIGRSRAKEERMTEVLKLVGLQGMERRMPYELSGGEQQRVALARALAPQPAVVLLDEPFSNLDAQLRTQVRNEVKQILTEAAATSIFVTHDQEEALLLGDMIAVMSKGKIEQVDNPEDIFHAPRSTFVARFMGSADFLPATVSRDVLITELGQLPWAGSTSDKSVVEVMVRPDDIALHQDETSEARIVDKVFQGIHNNYTVRLPSGTEVHCLMEHFRSFNVGDRVRARLEAGHSLSCFIDGERNFELPGR